ncbi:DUF4188 domain-containing protein [Nocardiopsis coralliicola]
MARKTLSRTTHRHEGELVVFLIGMTINRPHRPDQWLPPFRAMPAMLRELSADPDSGMLGYRLTLEGGHPTVIQYWNSLDKLYAYASDTQAKHRPAWRAFNRRAARAPGAVGIWHETYLVARAESVYSATPPMGLARATEQIPVRRSAAAARERMRHGATYQ